MLLWYGAAATVGGGCKVAATIRLMQCKVTAPIFAVDADGYNNRC